MDQNILKMDQKLTKTARKSFKIFPFYGKIMKICRIVNGILPFKMLLWDHKSLFNAQWVVSLSIEKGFWPFFCVTLRFNWRKKKPVDKICQLSRQILTKGTNPSWSKRWVTDILLQSALYMMTNCKYT